MVNIMDALRASIDAEKKKAPAPSGKARRPLKRRPGRSDLDFGRLRMSQYTIDMIARTVALAISVLWAYRGPTTGAGVEFMTIGVVTRAMTAVELDSSALRDPVAFTGRLACMTRDEAFKVVRQHGGMPSETVTKRTKLLIVGELGWPLLDDGRPSNKLSRATAYGIPVASERRFLEWIGKALPDSVHKTYSLDEIAALSGTSIG